MSSSIQEGYEVEDMRQRSPADDRGDDRGDSSTKGSNGIELSSNNLNPLNSGVTSPMHMSSSQRSR